MFPVKTEIKKTDDGSHTLYVPELDEHYHSAYGAVQESMHVFIDAGLKYFDDKDELSILEVGFGTGLNTLLTLIETPLQKITYHAVEAFPLDLKTIKKLNYPNLMSGQESDLIFKKIHDADWDKEVKITDKFMLTKVSSKIQDTALPKNHFHLVYYDAFAPDVQPELWTEDIFNKIYTSMKPGGILVTYSSKGLVKQNLRAAGFTVKRLPGPPGKKHMVRAEKVDNVIRYKKQILL
jgi:tRNA U34 5-methylaminomethyl-2-thiouridine-forming methyltransferase MnmC